MTRPAGRADLRARSWEIIRDKRSPADLVQIALRSLVNLDQADIGDAAAGEAVARSLAHYAINSRGALMRSPSHVVTTDETGGLISCSGCDD
jgi:hypothetical protein